MKIFPSRLLLMAMLSTCLIVSFPFTGSAQSAAAAGEHKYSVAAALNSVENLCRLKMVDIDGTTTYSRMLKLNAPLHCINQQISLYPNPVSDILYIQRAATGDLYSICDNSGRIILRGTINKSIQDIDLRSLFSGMYFITIVNKSGKSQVLKFIKN